MRTFSLFVCLGYLVSEHRTAAGVSTLGLSPEKKEGGRFSYPGPTKPSSVVYPVSAVPEQCLNQTFCTIKPEDYPREAINEIFKDKPVFLGVKPQEDPLNNRFGDPSDESDCVGHITVEPLTMVRPDLNSNDWRKVVLAEGKFEQSVRLEKCSNPNAPCFTEFQKPPNKETFCLQKYSIFRILVWNDETGKSEPLDVPLPTCCSCHYRPSSPELLSKFGSNAANHTKSKP